ncbi:nicotinamide riboside transporter PnuC [Clostridium uliginosum]|uniref:Nicotinamide mononucleotide transporter n=1 Tax=Clostridium uliginosum TaxID=119641 RepID=A0A1I1IX34_9CLOT|nr:nicotinamide riboside transporter PnuC [Clostridium uliginosum]SFC40847.1 nicotinamide mononucleotide transporter [Clostridium uliginosum]
MNFMKKCANYTCSSIFVIASCAICLIVGYIIGSSPIEIFASVMGIINVWLLSKEKVSNFIFGIITVLAYLYIYYKTGLYALAILACCQVGFNMYGWYYWVKNSDKEANVVTSGLTKKGQIIWSAVILIAWAVWGYVEINILHAQNAILDSLTAVLGLVAQYWLSKKLYENWILWILSNLLFIIIYILNGYYVMLILVVIQLILSIAGLLEWHSSYKEQGENKLTL